MAPTTYLEQDFEEHIEDCLLKSNYIKQASEAYNKELCLIPSEIIEFIKSTINTTINNSLQNRRRSNF